MLQLLTRKNKNKKITYAANKNLNTFADIQSVSGGMETLISKKGSKIEQIDALPKMNYVNCLRISTLAK